MPLYKTTIELLVELDNEAEVFDFIAETFRPLHFENGPLRDWQYAALADNAQSRNDALVPLTHEEAEKTFDEIVYDE